MTHTPVILMPTRGGPASYLNQDRAIALARESGSRLVFMYVAHARFLSGTSAPILVDMESEMEELGEFLLAMAQERARAAGVTADTLLFRGQFDEALTAAITASGATTLILGSAAGKTGLTTPRYRRGLVHDLLSATGIDVLILEEGEIVDRYSIGDLPADEDE